MTRSAISGAIVGGCAVLAFAAAAVFYTIPAPAAEMCGLASFYGTESGKRTANGERFDGTSLTAASRALPFGTILIVRNVQNGRIVRVRINDRGPFIRGRFLDLSKAAAARIGMLNAGVARVCAERVR